MLKRLLSDLGARLRPAKAEAQAARAESVDAFERVAALQRERRLDEALAALAAARAAQPADPRAAFLEAEDQRLRARYAEATPLYRRALLADVRNASGWAGLGDCFARCGDHEQAYITYRTALSLDASRADVHNELGMVNLALGNRSLAGECFDQALNLDPGNADAWNNFGLVAATAGKLEEARRRFHRAVLIRPAFYTALCNLGLVCRDLGRLEEARQALEAATRHEPARAAAWVNLAAVLQDEGALEDAEGAMRHAVDCSPDDASTLVANGTLMMRRARLEEATRDIGRALAVAPDDPEARLAQAHLDLLRGRYAEGWDRYEARLSAANSPRRRFPYPEWDGTRPAGRSLLVYAEQGVGETIMFSSCLPDLMRDGAACQLHCEDRMWPLMERSFPGLRRYAPDAQPVDAYAAIGSLPRLYRRDEGAFPLHDGYLRADPGRVSAFLASLGEPRDRLRVGLAWSGGLPSTGRALRSLALSELDPLFRVTGVQWIVLQVGPLGTEVEDLAARTGVAPVVPEALADGLEGLAACTAAMDLVITVCSSIAHLGGALGRPTWVLTPFAPAWRYRSEGDGMPWYPAVRLYRQAAARQWGPVVERARADLAARVESR